MADQVEEVKAKTDIVALIGSYLDLKKAGRNYKALCPFHSEKTPSFMVSPELQMYKCFGCSESGDAFTFLERYEGMDFPEALKFLAEKAGVKLEPGSFGRQGEKQRFIEINAQAKKFYTHVLFNHPAGKEALNYLLKERGLKKETLEVFELGFSPLVPFAARKFLVEKKKFSLEELGRAGIVFQGEKGAFDRFRGRVIFPLVDHRGNPVGFAGRLLPKDEKKDLAKYINSPETPVYHKGSLLYGLNLTKGDIKKKDQAVIVEGELDLISSWQAGVKNVVATKGTALTEDQVRLLSRFTKDAVLAMDADLAGDAAARRGIAIAQKEGLTLKVARLGKYKDPDEIARENPGLYQRLLNEAVEVWDFIIEVVFSRHKTLTGETKAKIGREIVPVLASIDDEILRAHYIEVVAKRLGVPTQAVFDQIAKLKRSEEISLVTSEQGEKKRDRRQLLEETFLSLAFQSDPERLLAKGGRFIEGSLTTKIYDAYQRDAKNKKKFNLKTFAESLPPELKSGFSEIVLKDAEEFLADPEKLEKEIDLVIKEMKIIKVREALKALAVKIKDAEEREDAKRVREAERRFAKLTSELSILEEGKREGIIL